MLRNTNGPIEGAPQAGRSSRRDLLKRALVVLGAGVLLQPYGGISGSVFAQDDPSTKPHCSPGTVLSPGPPWECRKKNMKCLPGKMRDRSGRCVYPPPPKK